MSPPPSKDWWLAAALTSAALPAAAQPATRPDGVVTTVTRPGAAQPGVRHVQMSGDSARGQRITTDANTAVHVLFADQSAITVAPNSDVVIRQYEFNDQTRDGSIAVELTKGLLRVVGGLVSKNKPTRVFTATATVGIRGGISAVEVDGLRTYAAFLFGEELTMDVGPDQISILRPGFGAEAGPDGLFLPTRAIFQRVLDNLLARLQTGPDSQQFPGTTGGVPVDPNAGTPSSGAPPGDNNLAPPDLPGLLGSPAPGNQS